MVFRHITHQIERTIPIFLFYSELSTLNAVLFVATTAAATTYTTIAAYRSRIPATTRHLSLIFDDKQPKHSFAIQPFSADKKSTPVFSSLSFTFYFALSTFHSLHPIAAHPSRIPPIRQQKRLFLQQLPSFAAIPPKM
jgi:hypothetical protein